MGIFLKEADSLVFLVGVPFSADVLEMEMGLKYWALMMSSEATEVAAVGAESFLQPDPPTPRSREGGAQKPCSDVRTPQPLPP